MLTQYYFKSPDSLEFAANASRVLKESSLAKTEILEAEVSVVISSRQGCTLSHLCECKSTDSLKPGLSGKLRP